MADRGRPLPEEDRRRIERLLREGKPKAQVAKLVEVNRSTIYRLINAKSGSR